jgi:hypothetical protein
MWNVESDLHDIREGPTSRYSFFETLGFLRRGVFIRRTTQTLIFIVVHLKRTTAI